MIYTQELFQWWVLGRYNNTFGMFLIEMAYLPSAQYNEYIISKRSKQYFLSVIIKYIHDYRFENLADYLFIELKKRIFHQD